MTSSTNSPDPNRAYTCLPTTLPANTTPEMSAWPTLNDSSGESPDSCVLCVTTRNTSTCRKKALPCTSAPPTGMAAAPNTMTPTSPTAVSVTVMRYTPSTESAPRRAVSGTSAIVAMQAHTRMPPKNRLSTDAYELPITVEAMRLPTKVAATSTLMARHGSTRASHRPAISSPGAAPSSPPARTGNTSDDSSWRAAASLRHSAHEASGSRQTTATDAGPGTCATTRYNKYATRNDSTTSERMRRDPSE